jgi:hypothetical protein
MIMILDSVNDFDTVVVMEECTNCNNTVHCTTRQLLEQPRRSDAIYDEDAAWQCEECGTSQYVNGVCLGGEASFGSQHHHCVECEDFGVCIHDHNSDHCKSCGNHYFSGSYTRLDCPICGSSDEDNKGICPTTQPFPTWPAPKPVISRSVTGEDNYNSMRAFQRCDDKENIDSFVTSLEGMLEGMEGAEAVLPVFKRLLTALSNGPKKGKKERKKERKKARKQESKKARKKQRTKERKKKEKKDRKKNDDDDDDDDDDEGEEHTASVTVK